MAGISTGFADERTAAGERCFAAEELSAFSAGRFPEPESRTIFRHLATCQSCSERLEKLPSADALSSILRNTRGAIPILDEPECARLQSALQTLPLRAREAASPAKEATVSSRLAGADSEPTPAGATPHAPTIDDTVSCPPSLPGRIGRYEIQRSLGQGSFGRVFLALDPDLHRQVALKVPRHGMVMRQPLIDAFLQEARTVARLNHPGIVTIYEVGHDRDFGCFIAMEYVEGKSLKQLQAAGRIPAAEAAQFVAQAAEAVHYAHKQKLVHRDIKPANLLVNGEGRLKVADFGLALIEEEQRGRAGEFAGTIAYVSPEQMRAETEHLDGRTDVYSLGVVLYELLAGRRPFTGTADEIRNDVLNRPPKPPRQIDDTIPPALEQVCLKCLAKDTAARYSTAKDLANDLTAAIHPATLSPAPSAPPTAVARGRFAGISAAALVLVGLLIVGFWFRESALGPSDQESSQTAPAPQFVPVPYDVDSSPKFELVRLLNGEPREIFPRVTQGDDWHLVPAEERLIVDSPSEFMVGLGKTSASQFTLNTNISKTAFQGRAGFFLGFKSLPPERGGWEFEFIGVHGIDAAYCQVERVKYRVEEQGHGPQRAFHNETLASVPIGPWTNDRFELEISVVAHRLRSVRWQGMPLPALTDREKFPPVEMIDSQGEFGVISVTGNTVFHHPTIRLD